MPNAFDITQTHKLPGKIWTGLSVPAADSYLTIGTDGVPDATENPNAKLVGLTDNGSECTISRSFTEEYFDEFKQPLEQSLEQVGMMIKCSAAQIMDFDLLAAITPGVGTKQTGTGKDGIITIGEVALTYSGVAVIFPLKANLAKYGVFHIYKGFQKNDISFAVSRQTRSKIDLEFHGVAIPTRDKDDLMGAIWKQALS